jgi:hypothetical protein
MYMDDLKIIGIIVLIFFGVLIGVVSLIDYAETSYCNTYDNLGWNTKVVQVGPFSNCMLEYNGRWVYRKNLNIIIGEINYENGRN